ncbi:MAG: NTP transferase domain-containing protein [Candidatus Latescibacteria bacterium]|jgi:bifunctional UDP-N-acetylglucosamine pyrophosphorylase / glucosamine-1-phosphate N-acetyltransferase|nr:NTP transferase domain-containing protein [Candidatus Latescibacterota bacterium]MBT5830111.1 NTP transferase domain-containing protein [Candidatus Latescibacterota bacterium]
MAKDPCQVQELLNQLNSEIDPDIKRIGIVLAAGHGKRIRSETSKMLHEIWGRPSALRVAEAIRKGLISPNQVVVVGIKGADVARATGAQKGRLFAYQENPVLGLPAGTGDAVRVGLEAFPNVDDNRDVYIFLGDTGLLRDVAVDQFRCAFESEVCDMMMFTGVYSGSAETNYYGRILRVPKVDVQSTSSGEDFDKVIEIREHKDILVLDDQAPYEVKYNGRTYAFTRQELLETREINTGIFALKEGLLRKYIHQLNTDNIQGELMFTDFVHLFNQDGLVVRAAVAENEEDILGFNVKSVLRQMEAIARGWAYDQLKDTITIVDEEDFFIADEVIEQILILDKDHGPLDIVVGKGAYLGPDVHLNRNVNIGDHCHLSGHIILGQGVSIGVGVEISAYPGQTMTLGEGVEILNRNILKGNMEIGAQSRIEAGVIMTGSDEHPMRMGERVTVKGTSYLYGCVIDDDLLIEHSIIKGKRVEQVKRRDGSIQPIRYVLPQPEGLDSISEL